jgi:hypothetical protein
MPGARKLEAGRRCPEPRGRCLPAGPRRPKAGRRRTRSGRRANGIGQRRRFAGVRKLGGVGCGKGQGGSRHSQVSGCTGRGGGVVRRHGGDAGGAVIGGREVQGPERGPLRVFPSSAAARSEASLGPPAPIAYARTIGAIAAKLACGAAYGAIVVAVGPPNVRDGMTIASGRQPAYAAYGPRWAGVSVLLTTS